MYKWGECEVMSKTWNYDERINMSFGQLMEIVGWCNAEATDEEIGDLVNRIVVDRAKNNESDSTVTKSSVFGEKTT